MLVQGAFKALSFSKLNKRGASAPSVEKKAGGDAENPARSSSMAARLARRAGSLSKTQSPQSDTIADAAACSPTEEVLSSGGMTAEDKGPKKTWDGPVHIVDAAKQGKWKKAHAVVFDGGADFGAGWRPRLEIYGSKKEATPGKKSAPAAAAHQLAGATVVEDYREKKEVVFKVQDASGAELIKFKEKEKEFGAWRARIAGVSKPDEAFEAAGAASKEEAEALAAEEAARKEQEDIAGTPTQHSLRSER